MILLGIDPAIANTGVAVINLDKEVQVIHLGVIKTSKDDHEGSDLEGFPHTYRARDIVSKLYDTISYYCPEYICVEVPGGTQSASAAMGSGVTNGICGWLAKEYPTRFLPTKPLHVKWDTIGKQAAKGATGKAGKDLMINWATNLYPEAPWPRRNGNGPIVKGKAEHLADAIAIIYSSLTRHGKSNILKELR